MNQLIKNWPALLILLGGILAAYGSWVSSNRNDEQQQAIKDTGDENKLLAKHNSELGTQIKSLQGINNAIVGNTEELVKANQKLTNENILITTKTKALIENVEHLTLKVNNLISNVQSEITGGKSVPIVSASLRFNPVFPSRSRYEVVPQGFDEKWVVDFTIKNYGKHTLRYIDCSRTLLMYADAKGKIEIPLVNLRSEESRTLFPTEIVNHNDGENIYSITVKWQVQYTYYVKLQAVPTPELIHGSHVYYTFKELYVYKRNNYEKPSELIAAIEPDLKE